MCVCVYYYCGWFLLCWSFEFLSYFCLFLSCERRGVAGSVAVVLKPGESPWCNVGHATEKILVDGTFISLFTALRGATVSLTNLCV